MRMEFWSGPTSGPLGMESGLFREATEEANFEQGINTKMFKQIFPWIGPNQRETNAKKIFLE